MLNCFGVPVKFSTVSVRFTVICWSASTAPNARVADFAAVSQAAAPSSTERLTRNSPAPMRVIGASCPG